MVGGIYAPRELFTAAQAAQKMAFQTFQDAGMFTAAQAAQKE